MGRRTAVLAIALAGLGLTPSASSASSVAVEPGMRTYDWVTRNPGWLAHAITFRPDGAALVASPTGSPFADHARADGHVHLIRRPGEMLSEANRWTTPVREVVSFAWRRGELWVLAHPRDVPCRQDGRRHGCANDLYRLDPETGAVLDGPVRLYIATPQVLVVDPLTDRLTMFGYGETSVDGEEFFETIQQYDPDRPGPLTTLFTMPNVAHSFSFSRDGARLYINEFSRVTLRSRTGEVLVRTEPLPDVGILPNIPVSFVEYHGAQHCLRGLLLYRDAFGTVYGMRLPVTARSVGRRLAIAVPPHDPAVDPVTVGHAVAPDGAYVGNDSSGFSALACASTAPPPTPVPPRHAPRPAAPAPAVPPGPAGPAGPAVPAQPAVPGVAPAGLPVTAPAPGAQAVQMFQPAPGAYPGGAFAPFPREEEETAPVLAGAMVVLAMFGLLALVRRRRERLAPNPAARAVR